MSSTSVCLLANTLNYPQGGGHFWAYLNWALGLHSLGCQVIWLESVSPGIPEYELQKKVASLKSFLERYGLAEYVALCSLTDEWLPREATEGCLDLELATEMDLLLDIRHDTHPGVVKRFRRSAFVDIDPGILQFWMSKGVINVAPHDVYFTIGETVGQPEARFPDAGLKWHYTPPCVALNWWPPHCAEGDASFTTVSHWYDGGWMEEEGEMYPNNKRAGFFPFLDLPHHTAQPLELALCLNGDEKERVALLERGWRLCEAWEVTSTPWDYQRYVQGSLGEFSCVKPSCVRLQNAWISDRTLCYLASGKPAVIQYTGPSPFLSDAAGLFRFRDLKEAAHCLDRVMADYEQQCKLARALAEEHFDARKVVGRVLEVAFG